MLCFFKIKAEFKSSYFAEALQESFVFIRDNQVHYKWKRKRSLGGGDGGTTLWEELLEVGVHDRTDDSYGQDFIRR